jgi:lysophospholipase L1-like esterase
VAADVPAVNPLLLVEPVERLRPDEVRFMQQRLADWPELQRYRDANARLPAAVPGQPRVVFFGDSITEGWGREGSATFFPGKGWLNRGISGQTTAQMLVRFPQDVLALKPQVVVILAGTNDIAGNTGPSTQAMIEDNLHAMVDLARAWHSPWCWHRCCRSAITRGCRASPAPKVRALNTALKRYADAQQLVYLDYYTPMANAAGGLDQLADDGVSHEGICGDGAVGRGGGQARAAAAVLRRAGSSATHRN